MWIALRPFLFLINKFINQKTRKGVIMKSKYFFIIMVGFMLLEIPGIYSQSGWIRQNTGTSLKLHTIDFYDANLGFAMGQNGRMLRTTNGGNNWEILNSITSGAIRDVKVLSPQRVIAISRDDVYISLLLSTNGGVNWNISVFDFSNQYNGHIEINFMNSTFGVIAYDYKVKYTIDGGNNWISSVVNGSSINGWFQDIYMASQSTGYAVLYRRYSSVDRTAEIYKTTNGCETWDYTGRNFDHSDNTFDVRFGFSFLDAQNVWLCGMTKPYSGGNESYLAISANAFNTNSYSNLGSLKFIHDCFFVNYYTGWFIGDRGVYKTVNSGTTVVKQTGDEIMNDMHFINENTGWIVADTGKIFKTTNGGEPIGIQIISTEIPDKYELSQNYPNPFNPVTNIKFDIIKTGDLKLVIYDILGHEVITLFNQKLQAGKYEVDWNAVNSPSGIYFYRLETHNFTQTKKMIFIK